MPVPKTEVDLFVQQARLLRQEVETLRHAFDRLLKELKQHGISLPDDSKDHG
jgi:hypothetical protein